ncbi:MAG TPA: radical SAM protein [Firmicutes bacterium]|jgi:MoaA/NifB/PqqE/SkfB family radical SAM enzyme|nr:radical SAM protein [Bacillota bacterium]
MIIRRHSENYNFFGDTETGLTLRWSRSLSENPEYAPWPELADISISNHCSKGCEFCYRDSTPNQSFMSVKQYEFVLDSLHSNQWGNVFQVALGGGEPLEHPDFETIIQKTVQRGIVVNFTTNGINLDKARAEFLKGKIGALALSVHSLADLQSEKIKLLKEAGVRTNLHFVLDNQSLDEATGILAGSFNQELQNIDGLIFLTYKPKGRASAKRCLTMDERLSQFVASVDNNKCIARIGFDACFVPVLMNSTDVNVDYIDSCECGFFSVYIDEALNVKPCSFANNDHFSYSLNEFSFQTIWDQKYSLYRSEIKENRCVNTCKNKSNCRGKCSYYDALSFCYQESPG